MFKILWYLDVQKVITIIKKLQTKNKCDRKALFFIDVSRGKEYTGCVRKIKKGLCLSDTMNIMKNNCATE